MAKKKLKGDVAEIFEQYRVTKDYWRDFIDRSINSYKFVGGDQWDPEEIASFQTKRRPVVTINVLGKMVRQVTGMRTRERLMPRVLPEREGTVEKAGIYSKFLYHVLKKNDYQAINHDVQEDQVICGRGWYELFVDYEDDVRGELKLRNCDWNEVLPDYMCQDIWCRDARHMFRAKYLAKEDLLKITEKASELSGEPGLKGWTDVNGRRTKNPHDDYMDSGGNYLVIEKWELKTEKKYEVTDGKVWREVDQRLPQEILNQTFGEEVAQIERNTKVLKVTTIIPSIDSEQPISCQPAKLQLGAYTFVPVLCYKIADKIMGIVEDAKDEQKRRNKAFSQIIEILGFSAKGLWVYKDGSVNDDDFDANVARPGGKIKWQGSDAPQYVSAGAMPVGYAEIFKASEGNMEAITGINPALMGISEYAGESGIKFAQKLNQAREQFAVIDRRFVDSFNYVCKLMLRAIPKVYDYPYVFKALEGNDQVQDIRVNQPTLAGMINDLNEDTTNYDINIEQTTESSTLRQAELEELSRTMAQLGPGVSSLIIAEYVRGTDLPNKEDLAKRIELLSGQELQMRKTQMQLNMMQMQQSTMQAQQAGRAGAQQQQLEAQIKLRKEAREDKKAEVENESKALSNIADMVKITAGAV